MLYLAFDNLSNNMDIYFPLKAITVLIHVILGQQSECKVHVEGFAGSSK